VAKIWFIVTILTRSVVFRDCQRRAPSIAPMAKALFVVGSYARGWGCTRDGRLRAAAQGTTKSFFESDVVVNLLQLDAQRRMKRMSDLSSLVLSRCVLRDCTASTALHSALDSKSGVGDRVQIQV
jgi:hypothetical protein